ncbi:MAG: fused MFS/spermidine synthase [Bacillota bacterium]
MSERVVYDSVGISGRLQVIDRGNKRTMFLGSLPQTTVDLSDPDRHVGRYIPYLHAGSLFNPEPDRAMFLGLGGGAGVRSFHQTYPDCELRAVEIDENVVRVAREYFFVPRDERVSLVVEDGRRYLALNPGAFDHIILDAYNQDGYPSRLYTRECFELIHRALRSRIVKARERPGVVVVNAVGWLRGDKSESVRIIIRTMEAVFASVHLFEVPMSPWRRLLGDGNNFIMVGTTHRRTGNKRALLHRAMRRSDMKKHIDVVRRLRRLPDVGEAEILTDDKVERGQLILTV